MQVKQILPVGNFLVTLEAEVTPEQQVVLTGYGLRWMAQRVSEVDKVLGAFETGADGKAKRIKDWSRTDVEYSDALASKLASAYGTLKAKDGETEFKLEALVDVAEYVREDAAPKLAKERALYAKRGADGKLQAVADKIGYTGELGDGTAEGAPLEFLRSIKSWTDAQAAALGA